MGIVDFITRKPPELQKIDKDVRTLEADGRKILAELKRDSAKLELSWHKDPSSAEAKPEEIRGSKLMEEFFRDFIGLNREIKILEQIEKAKDNEKKRQQLRNHLPSLPEAIQKRFGFKEAKEKERILHHIAVIRQNGIMRLGPQFEMKISQLNSEIERRRPARQGQQAFVGQLNEKFERYKSYAGQCIHFYAQLKAFIQKLHLDLDELTADVNKLVS